VTRPEGGPGPSLVATGRRVRGLEMERLTKKKYQPVSGGSVVPTASTASAAGATFHGIAPLAAAAGVKVSVMVVSMSPTGGLNAGG
jgi:hypothetical protein